MIYRIEQTIQARQDLVNIAEYTLAQWGKTQLRIYLDDIEQTIQYLSETPESKGQNRDTIKPGLRSIPHENHYFIFYRVKDSAVQIIRILHQRRNWQRIMQNA